MSILTIIPARSGSKGVLKKNIKSLNGKPLIAYTIEASLTCDKISRTIVSTDCSEIAAISKMHGSEVPFLRPKELSQDDTPSIDVIIHCLDFLKTNENYVPDIICLLQCTSPLRTAVHLSEAIELFFQKSAVSVASVCESSKSPYWAKIIAKSGKIINLIKQENSVTRRQDAPKTYDLNGAIYINYTKMVRDTSLLVSDDTYPYIMDRKSSIDIDDEIDFSMASLLLHEKGGRKYDQ